MHSSNPNSAISGTVTLGLSELGRVEVVLDGKTYRGDWRVEGPTTEQRVETSYPHRRHIGAVSNILNADDGSKLVCQWKTHGNVADGSCVSGGREYPLNFN
jgi:hypothetical protein